MEQVVYWFAVGYDGSNEVLLRFETRGDDCRNKRNVLAALMEQHPSVQTETTTVSAIIESNGKQQPNVSISHEDDTLWVADID